MCVHLSWCPTSVRMISFDMHVAACTSLQCPQETSLPLESLCGNLSSPCDPNRHPSSPPGLAEDESQSSSEPGDLAFTLDCPPVLAESPLVRALPFSCQSFLLTKLP